MGAGAPLLEEESSTRLPLARQGANLVEKYKVSPKLVQAGPRSDVTDRDNQPAPLEIADGRTGLSPDEEPSSRQAAAGAIGGAPSADHGQFRSIQLGGQLGAGVAVNLDERPPGPGDPRDQQPLSSDALEPDVPRAQVQPTDELGVDLLVVPELGDNNRRSRIWSRSGSTITFHRAPRPLWPHQAQPAHPPGSQRHPGIHRHPERGGDWLEHSLPKNP